MANVQISEETFFKMTRYILLRDIMEPAELESIHASLSSELLNKINAMAMRELYSLSKKAATPEEREAARQEYLDKKGIPVNFRW